MPNYLESRDITQRLDNQNFGAIYFILIIVCLLLFAYWLR